MEKIKVTAQQRANALEARDVMWPSVPNGNVSRDLGEWTSGYHDNTDCNTIACFGGWCARWPGFQAQGVCLTSEGAPIITLDGWRGPFEVGEALFGDNLFSPRGAGRDVQRGLGEFTGTDHELITARLNWLIENSEVIS